VADPAAERVEVDLKRVTGIDGAGVRMLLRAAAAARRGRGVLVLLGCAPEVRSRLDAVGVLAATGSADR
jgi:anti-anti-sigma regulatory factor